MAELVPDDAITRYNLGVLYKLQRRPEDSRAAFERAAELDPNLAGARFQLATAYRQAGMAEAAAAAMAAFRELKAQQADAAVPEDLEWSFYAELYDPLAPHGAAAEPRAEPRFEASVLAQRLGEGGSLEVLDADGDGRVDVLVATPAAVELFLQRAATPRQEGDEADGGTVDAGSAEDAAATVDATSDRAAAAGAAAKGEPSMPGAERSEEPADGAAHPAPHSAARPGISQFERRTVVESEGIRAAVPGDFDDDGLPDLAVVAAGGVTLWHNAGGTFTRHGLALPEVATKEYRGAVWLDYDHDYDVDLLLLGEHSALLRNVGEGTFEDRSAAFPFADGTALEGVEIDLVPDTPGLDLAVSYADRPGVLYRDRLGGRYEAVELPQLAAGAGHLVTVDVDNDGFTDLAAVAPGGPRLLRNRPDGDFAALDLPAGLPSNAPALLVDLENRGIGELVAGDRLARNRGDGRFGEPAPVSAALGTGGGNVLAAADFDADGRTDLVARTGDGRVLLLANRTDTGNHWLGVALAGLKNLKLAPGAEIEVKAGTSYQKRLWRGVPLVFGLGPHDAADTVRITWPNGLIQNETRQAADRLARYEEAQRLSGSCPMVYTWNGREMEFVADVLGVAPLGAAAGDGVYFDVDHDEVLAIAGEQLAPRDGVYDVRMTEELREVGYLDQVKLLAVDHPRGVDVYHNDKFKGPPYPEFELFAVGDRIRPRAARDDRGRDVLAAVLARDGTWPQGFSRDLAAVAERHHLDLDFGAGPPGGEDGILVLDGWVDWADGSTFMAAAQSPGGPALDLPSLQVKDAAGRWRTVIEDMGLPSGGPKAIVVDMTGRWLSASRQVRIVTGLAVYWDEIFLAAPLRLVPPETHAPGRAAPGTTSVRTLEVPALGADLRFRGVSRAIVDPQRLRPEEYVYADVHPATMWDPIPGLYTRYGEVAELLTGIDDRFVVFGVGDELALRFDATALPALPPGWRRDFLLVVDGWAKDGDLNTAFARSVEPFPYHAMPGYPYDADHPFPDDEAHRRWREEYQTRPALRLTRPLRPVGVAEAKAKADAQAEAEDRGRAERRAAGGG